MKASKKLMAASIQVQVSHVVAVVLAGVAGALQVLNQTTLDMPSRYHAYLGLALVALAHVGVKPLVGSDFRDAVAFPNWLLKLLTVLAGAGTVALGTIEATSIWHIILAAALTVLVGLGFGPDNPQKPEPEPQPLPAPSLTPVVLSPDNAHEPIAPVRNKYGPPR